jgi:hypothetical protein
MRTALMTQPQLEALVDLLVLAMQADKRFSLVEEETFEQDLSELPWDSGIGLSVFVNASYSRARATSTLETQKEYIRTLCANFNQPEVRRDALAEIEKMLVSDGETAPENAFMTQLKNELHTA